jgi:hypothetical protein
MQRCPAQLCTLRPEVVNLDLADQIAMILACRIADAHTYFTCRAKQEAAAAWIEKHGAARPDAKP